jgi:AcrR family transcriptional regulator
MSTGGRTGSARGGARRDSIAAAALELFRERGYHGVGMDEIGQRAGVTGPAVYSHFRGKQDLLAAVLEPGIRRTRQALADAARAAAQPGDAIRALVTTYVGVALDATDQIDLYAREERNLPDAARRRLRRETKLIIDEWVRALEPHHPRASVAERQAMAYAIVALANSAAMYRSELTRGQQRELLERMALAAVGISPAAR